MRSIEYTHQITVVEYLTRKYPKALFNADCGGMRTSWTQAVKAKKAGHKKGFPDIFIAEPRNGAHGLFIEMKRPDEVGQDKGRTSPEQKQWLEKLAERGYAVSVCYGANEACDVIDKYFGDPHA